MTDKDATMPDVIYATRRDNDMGSEIVACYPTSEGATKYTRTASPAKVEGLDWSIKDIEAITESAANRTYETGMRTTVNGLTPLAVERVLQAASAYAALCAEVE
jgi:hypothetical protein